jgi:hypothetical protein
MVELTQEEYKKQLNETRKTMQYMKGEFNKGIQS